MIQLKSPTSNYPFYVVPLTILIYAICLTLIFWEDVINIGSAFDLRKSVFRGEFFHINKNYLLWTASMIIQPIIWIIFFYPAMRIISRLGEMIDDPVKCWVGFIVYIMAVTVFVECTDYIFGDYFSSPDSLLKNHKIKIELFTLAGQIVASSYLYGLILLTYLCMNIKLEINLSIELYRKFRSYMETLLNIPGVLLTLGVISTIIFSSICASLERDVEIFSMEFVIAFGLLNSFIILIVYLPAHFAIHKLGKALVEEKYRITCGNEIEDLKKQKELAEHLNLNLNFSQTFKKVLIILSPFIISLLRSFLIYLRSEIGCKFKPVKNMRRS